MSSLHVYFIYIVSIIQIKQTISDPLNVREDSGLQCAVELRACTLNHGDSGSLSLHALTGTPGVAGEKGDPGVMGPRGYPGDRGFPAISGEKGVKGEKGAPGPVGPPSSMELLGTKGEKGDAGIEGPHGVKGDKGENGFPGLDGMSGYPGVPGQKGYQGVLGLPGPHGVKGDKGENGFPGLDGMPGYPGVPGQKGYQGVLGLPGDPGNKGEQGPTGPPGTPGLPGVCKYTCSTLPPHTGSKPVADKDAPIHESDGASTRRIHDVGSKFKPAVNCQYIKKVSASGNWVNPNNRFQIQCNTDTNMTCIKTKDAELKPIYFKNKTKPFWISEIGFNFTSFFHGYTMEQLRWLQEHSSSVTMKMKYHCLNSIAYHDIYDRLDLALNLLSWNDVVMTPYPTNISPLFYSIDKESDGCKDSAPEWKYTDIVITSNIGNRLPIIDMYIKDVSPAELPQEKAFKLELKELCFG